MALRERATFAVLAGQAHRVPFLQQRTECKCFSGRPVDPLAGFDGFGAVFEEPLDRFVNSEALRDSGHLFSDDAQLGCLNAGIAPPGVIGIPGSLEPRPAAVEPVGLVWLISLTRLKLRIEAGTPIGLHFVDFTVGYHTFADKLLRIDFQRRWMRTDLFVHQRLRERGLVALVVTKPPVTE